MDSGRSGFPLPKLTHFSFLKPNLTISPQIQGTFLSFPTQAIRVRVLVPRPIKDTLNHHILTTTHFSLSSSVLNNLCFSISLFCFKYELSFFLFYFCFFVSKFERWIWKTKKKANLQSKSVDDKSGANCIEGWRYKISSRFSVPIKFNLILIMASNKSQHFIPLNLLSLFSMHLFDLFSCF